MFVINLLQILLLHVILVVINLLQIFVTTSITCLAMYVLYYVSSLFENLPLKGNDYCVRKDIR
jgi:hypothetical protein